MANSTEFSRLVFKRSTVAGVIPTIPTGTTIDSSWLSTDILIGEAFVNVADDRAWMRTNNGIVELFISGNTYYRYTTGATLTGNVLSFDWNDQVNAYSVDLSAIVLTGATGNYLPLSGGVMTGDITSAFNKGIKYNATTNIKFEGALGYTGTSINGNLGNAYVLVGNRFDGGVELGSYQASSILGMYTNTSSIEMYDNSEIVINDNAIVAIGVDTNRDITIADNTATPRTSTNTNKKSVFIGSQNSTFNSGITNSVILGGTLITATTSSTVYVPRFNIKTVGSDAPIINLGLDANGYIVTGTTASASFTGGTVGGATTFSSPVTINSTLEVTGTSLFKSAVGITSTLNVTGVTTVGNITINGTATITGDTVVKELSATSITILNSGSTTRNYTDYSGNIIRTGVTNSTIIAGSGNTISADLRNVLVAGSNLTATANDSAYFSNVNIANTLSATTIYAGGVNTNWCDLSFAISDETTAITSGDSKLTIYAPYAFTITKVIATLSTSGSSQSQFDVNLNGTTIFSRRPTIDANEFHSDDATAGLPTYSTTSVAYKDKITIDIDQAGTGANGAKIYILGNRV